MSFHFSRKGKGINLLDFTELRIYAVKCGALIT